jgi:FtsZ-interacting cell division protein ZipA
MANEPQISLYVQLIVIVIAVLIVYLTVYWVNKDISKENVLVRKYDKMDMRYDTPYKNDRMTQFDDDGNFKDKKNKPKSKMDQFDDDGNYKK